jgi:hypothetical protein
MHKGFCKEIGKFLNIKNIEKIKIDFDEEFPYKKALECVELCYSERAFRYRTEERRIKEFSKILDFAKEKEIISHAIIVKNNPLCTSFLVEIRSTKTIVGSGEFQGLQNI